MFKDIIIFLIVLIILSVLFRYTSYSKEGFRGGELPDSHNQFNKNSGKKYSNLANTINFTAPPFSSYPVDAIDLKEAVNGLVATGQSKGYGLSPSDEHTLPDAVPATFQMAASCEAAPNSCSAFDDSTFASQCGLSFDLTGKNANGQTHIGGLYVAPDDRNLQMKKAKDVLDKNLAPFDPYKVYQPTLGSAKSGQFALTKDQCTVVKERIECETKGIIGKDNCTQCYSSQDRNRVGPETNRLPFSLFLFGTGSFKIIPAPGRNYDSLANLPSTLKEDQAVNGSNGISIPSDSEGDQFTIQVTPLPQATTPVWIAGYVQGPTRAGKFTVDLRSIILAEGNGGYKPRLSGTRKLNGMKCFSIIPNNGKKDLSLPCTIPFSFMNINDFDSSTCGNGPVLTKESSAKHFGFDACYKKSNKPGSYDLECLQSRWTDLGGTTIGTGYPSDQEKADAIQKGPRGEMLDISTIVDNLGVKMAQAITGKYMNGAVMELSDWNDVSMFMTGVPINTPCDGPDRETGPLSKECLSYLYSNKGISSKIGATYSSSPSEVASMLGGQTFPNTYCQPGTAIDPNTPSGLAFGQTLGGVEATKQAYNQINRTANDNSITNAQREKAVKDCYGIQLGSMAQEKYAGPKQVYAVGPDYRYKKSEAQAVCQKYGGNLATTAQLQAAQKMGADWCFSGWVSDGGGKWPITTTAIDGCGSRTGIIEWTPDSQMAGVNCYGPKPRRDDVPDRTILPFNGDLWDQPKVGDNPIYSKVAGGYIESTSTAGNDCFSNISVAEAKRICTSRGKKCAGFKYSTGGGGNGCFLGNQAGKKVNNGRYGASDYTGYVKIPFVEASTTITGRYIRVQYNKGQCLNLAGIKVYQTNGGPDIIKPNMVVEKPSGWNGDEYPGRYFVDGDLDNFVHTSCAGDETPFVQVDLGAMTTIYKVVIYNREECCRDRVVGARLQIMDDEKDIIYNSDAIGSTNRTYAFFPPSPGVRPDLPEDAPPPKPRPRRDRSQPPPGYGTKLPWGINCKPGYYNRVSKGGDAAYWGCGYDYQRSPQDPCQSLNTGNIPFTGWQCECACARNNIDPPDQVYAP